MKMTFTTTMLLALSPAWATAQALEGWAVSLERSDVLLLTPSMSVSWIVNTGRYYSMTWSPDRILWVCDSGFTSYIMGLQFSNTGAYSGAVLGWGGTFPPPSWNVQMFRDGLLWAHGNNGIWTTLPNVYSQTPVYIAPIPSGLFHDGAAYDGRRLFCVEQTPQSGATSHTIWVVDLRHPAHQQWTIGRFSLTAASPPVHRPMTLGPDGNLLMFDSSTAELKLIDAETGVATTLSPQLLVADVRSIAYNHWTDTTMVLAPVPGVPGVSPPLFRVYEYRPSVGVWQLRHTHYGEAGWQIESLSTPPFEVFGHGCSNAIGVDPAMGWQGLPLQAASFSITLRNAEPNGFAVMWLGWSDTYWAGIGPLPFAGAPYGAPGCSLLVSPDGPVPFLVNGSGRASYDIVVPGNPAIAGMQVFAQSVSTSGSNALGFSSSDALVIRLR